jgi:quinol monooxygenase YgiN
MVASVSVEPGVLAICAIAEKDNPSKFRFFEMYAMYADDAEYKAHRESPHFKKYAEVTKNMIRYSEAHRKGPSSAQREEEVSRTGAGARSRHP